MLILLPVAAFFALFLNTLGVDRKKWEDPPDGREAFLIAAVISGAIVTVITEGLSLFNGISQLWIAVLWAITLFMTILYGISTGAFSRAIRQIRFDQISTSRFDSFILGSIAILLLTLFVVAWISPPNNTDSLQYHIPRIVHWIQNATLKHYPTAYNPQLWNPPFAETAILNLWLLWGNDQPVNMVQWFSMIGALIGTTALARRLGAGIRGQLFTAAFVISIPIGTLESTSTQTDYVTAFWLVCLAYFIVVSKERDLKSLEWFVLATAAGLGVLTKGTFYPYAFPFLLWYFIPRLKKNGWRKTFAEALSFGGIALFLNLGYWVRNIITYGGPLGTQAWIEDRTAISWHPQTWISGVVTKIAQNFPAPWENVNDAIISIVRSIDHFLGFEQSRFSLIWFWNHDDLAGNPIHLIAIFLSIPILAWVNRKRKNSLVFQLTFVVLASFLIYAVVVTFDFFGVRYQLPFFVIASVLVGALVSQIRLNRIRRLMTTFFLIISIPWVLFNSTRPIIGMRPFPEPMAIPCRLGCTSIGSILTRSRADLLFANWIPLKNPISSATALVESSGCQEVGLMIDSQHREYLFLWSLGAPSQNIRVETVYTDPELNGLIDPDFIPCAVICSICGKRTQIYGIQRAGAYENGISVFMGSGFTYDEIP